MSSSAVNESPVVEGGASPSPSSLELLHSIVEATAANILKAKDLHAEAKKAYREAEREFKRLQKEKRDTRSREPRTVVQKPVRVNADMEAFMKKMNIEQQEGGFTRKVMMKAVSDYIRSNKLQVETNKKDWKPDATLRKLFSLKADQTCNFMNVNGFISLVVLKA